jgi:hypothetical protein
MSKNFVDNDNMTALITAVGNKLNAKVEGHAIQNESGTDLTQRDTMQFTGQAKATDDSTNGKTIIDVSPEVIDWDDWRQMTDQEKEAIPEAMIENAPGVDGLLSATLLPKLWENPDPTSNFAAQNVTLSESATNYDYLLIEYLLTQGSPKTASIMFKNNTGTSLTYASPSSNGAQSRARDVNYVNATTLSFSDGYIATGTTAAAAHNGISIPLNIYGIKKDINLEFSAIASDVSTSADKCMLSDEVTSVEDKLGDIDTTLSSLGAAATKGVATSVQSGNTNLVTSDAVNTKVNSVVSAMGIYENEVTNVSAPNNTNFCAVTLPAGTYIAVAVYQSSTYAYAFITTNTNKPQIYSNVDVFTLTQQTTVALRQGSGATHTYSYAHLVALKIK